MLSLILSYILAFIFTFIFSLTQYSPPFFFCFAESGEGKALSADSAGYVQGPGHPQKGDESAASNASSLCSEAAEGSSPLSREKLAQSQYAHPLKVCCQGSRAERKG